MTYDEVIFNFTNHCNMHCRFCYVPFSHHSIDDGQIARIAHRISQLQFKRIVVGGGDPLIYPKLIQLLKFFFDNGHEVHVDSNFKVVPSKFIDQLKEAKISLSFGIPVDGSNDKIHSLMRDEQGHFQMVCHWISKLLTAGFEVKVNTVVSAQNIEDINNIELLLLRLGVKHWSLYQFWPMEKGLENIEKYSINTYEFDTVVSSLRARTTIKIGGGNIVQRKPKYFFVRSDGTAYTVNGLSLIHI